MKRLVILLALLAAPARADAPADYAYAQHPGAALPVTEQLTDSRGMSASLGRWLGGTPAIIALGYFACPNLCGIERADLYAALDRAGLQAGRDYTLLAVSIDPAETPRDAAVARDQALAVYPQGKDWHFLVGDSTALQRAVGFRARYDAQYKQFLHPSGLVFATPDGRVSSYLLGVGYQPGDVQAGLARARQGVAAAALPVLLLCFHFDTTTGRYTLAIVKLLRLAAFLTIATLGGVLLLLRRERR